jgi:hypothetical protein
MHETDAGDLLSEQELRVATNIDRYSLIRVRRWLFLKPARTFRGRGAGSQSYYPAVAVPMIQRFYELRRETRKIDECVWRLWLEDFPIDICKWADARLALRQKELALVKNGGDPRNLVGKAPARSDARQPIYGRLRPKEEISLLTWAMNVIAGTAPAKSLYDPASPAFDALKNAAGLSEEWQPPDPELSVEGLSLSHLLDVLRGASTAEMEQARRDWKAIAQLVEASEAIDWHVTRKALNVQRTSSVQPPAPADFLLRLWRNFDARAVFVAALIDFRRSPDHSRKLSEILAVASWALTQFLQRTRETATAAEPAGTEISPDAHAGTGEPRP